MSYRVHVDQSVNCVFVQHYGVYEVLESSDQLRALESHPKFVKGMHMLRDVTQTQLPKEYNLNWFSTHAETGMKEVDEPLGSARRVAWLLGNAQDFKTIHQWTVSNRLNRFVNDRQPFRNLSVALEWLNIPADYEITYPDT